MTNAADIEGGSKLFAIWRRVAFFVPRRVCRANAAPAWVDELHGTVEKRAVGALNWEKVTPGEKIEEGSSIRTGEPTPNVIILTEQGHHFEVRAETTIEFTSLQDDETKTRLDQGRVLSKVRKLKSNEKFSVQTPTAVCAVRGTEFDTVTGQAGTLVSVYHGVVGVAALGTSSEVRVPAGQMTSVHNGMIELPRPIPHQARVVSAESPLARAARHEVGLDMTRNQVIASAAMEQRTADYREGKSLIDVNGKRVRVEEYIVRPQPDQFKLVVLDKRDNRLDYFYYLGTFNQTLPADLSVALKTSFRDARPECAFLLPDRLRNSAIQHAGFHPRYGHRRPSRTDHARRKWKLYPDGSDESLQHPHHSRRAASDDGTYKVYNPLAGQFLQPHRGPIRASTKFGVYIPENDTFKDLAPGDTLWKTRFNDYTHHIDNVTKITYGRNREPRPMFWRADLDANFTYAGGSVADRHDPDRSEQFGCDDYQPLLRWNIRNIPDRLDRRQRHDRSTGRVFGSVDGRRIQRRTAEMEL